MQLILKVEKPTAQTYFERNFQNPELEWKDMYTLPRCVTINAKLYVFPYKLLHDILYLNEMLYKSEKKYPHIALFLWKSMKFSDTAFFPKCTINISNYTTEHYL